MADEIKGMIDAIKGNIASAPTEVLAVLERQLNAEGTRLALKLSTTFSGHWLDAEHYAKLSHTCMALGMVYQALSQSSMRGDCIDHFPAERGALPDDVVTGLSPAATNKHSAMIFQSILRLTGKEGSTIRCISAANRDVRLEKSQFAGHTPDDHTPRDQESSGIFEKEDLDFIFQVN
jgi:hypothetical protein